MKLREVEIEPADIAARFDDTMQAAFDRGLAEDRAAVRELQHAVRHNAEFVVRQLVEVNRRLAALEEAS